MLALPGTVTIMYVVTILGPRSTGIANLYNKCPYSVAHCTQWVLQMNKKNCFLPLVLSCSKDSSVLRKPADRNKH